MTRTQTVDGVFVKAGDYVSEGDLLFTYDIATDRANLERRREQVLINLDNAVIGLDLLELSAKTPLAIPYGTDEETADEIRQTAEDIHDLQIKQQENIIRLCRLELEQIDSELGLLTEETRSSVSGYAASVHVREGAVAAKGVLLAELADITKLIIHADITEFDAPLLSEGLIVRITAGGFPGRFFDGYITKVSAGAVEKDRSGGTERAVPVEISVNGADGVLKDGFTVDLEIFTFFEENALSVPVQSILPENGRFFVYVFRGEALEKREVAVGLRGERRAVILSGINEGDWVVVNQAGIQAKHR
jgi:multidrug efflux pump subunit AcrA (membrane-fusion protein)